jgi:hypothetical protein
MKNLLKLFFLTIIFISLVLISTPILAAPLSPVGSTRIDVSDLTLPQPEEIIVANMQPPPTPPPPVNSQPQEESLFGRLLQVAVTKPPQPSPLPAPTSSPAPTPPPRQTQKDFITIALIGDSMVDTMGTWCPYLNNHLKKTYPQTHFELLNYGVGSTNILSALDRLTQPLSYQDRNYPSPLAANPDVVIIESFAYNPLPLSEDNLQQHQQILSQLANLVRNETSAQLFFLTTIAPHHQKFGTGPNGVNWDSRSIVPHTEAIHAYLENTINTARNLGIPVIDAFHSSQDSNGNGREALINPGDHIHPSVAGHQFLAQTIAHTLISSRVLE